MIPGCMDHNVIVYPSFPYESFIECSKILAVAVAVCLKAYAVVTTGR